jgi:hypothetical protein
MHGLRTIPDRLRAENEFQRRNNAIRFDRQYHERKCQRRMPVGRAPPVTLYQTTRFLDQHRCQSTGEHNTHTHTHT